MKQIFAVAYDLLNGNKSLRDLSAEECISIIEAFYKTSADEYKDIVPSAKENPEVYLAVLQHGVKIALNRAGDNDEYYAYVSQREQ